MNGAEFLSRQEIGNRIHMRSWSSNWEYEAYDILTAAVGPLLSPQP